MRHTPRTIYFVLIAWCIIGPILRIVWFWTHGLPVDALPIITLALAVVGLVGAFRPERGPRRSDP